MVTRSGDPGGGERTTGQPPRDEHGAGTVNYESEQTAAELMNRVLSLVRSGLRKWLQGLEPEEKDLANLKSFLNTVVSGNTEGTAELETIIKIAFQYIQKFGIDDRRSSLPADLVVKIAIQLRKAVDNIVFEPQFSYETKKEFLERLISLIVGLILKVGPNDSDGSEFRGVKFKEADRVHPNNALLAALDEAARILLNEAAALNNPKELIGTMSDLLKMTEKLRVDELRTIYIYIRDQLGRIINQSVDQYQ